MHLRVGTRGSRLAVTQSEWICTEIKKKHPHVTTELVIIKTKGDQILDKALDKIGDKGLFVKEIEDALIEERIDIAIHSMKDMPSGEHDDLTFTLTPKREDRRDVLILNSKYKSLQEVPEGSVIGTGSKRRKYLMQAIRPDLKFTGIRGNVETRMRKVESENLAGTILAAAGLIRLGLEDCIAYTFKEEEFVPAPAQGALAVQYKSSRDSLRELLDSIVDLKSHHEITAERAFMKYINGGCHAPVGAYAVIDKERLLLTGYFGKDDGSYAVTESIEGLVEDGYELGKVLAERLLVKVSER